MGTSGQKTVIVVDRDLPTGLAVNAASIVASMMTTAIPTLMGPAVQTRDVQLPGVVLVPLPVLAGSGDLLQSIWARSGTETDTLRVFPFTRLAQGCKTYEEYTTKATSASASDLLLAAIGLVGASKAVTSLTGDISLYPTKEKSS